MPDLCQREDEAATRIPQDGVPEHLQCCTQHVEGSDKAPVRLLGPASRAPELLTIEEAGEDSESHSDGDDGSTADDGAHQTDVSGEHDIAAENAMALDPVSDIAPVRMMQALQGSIEALQAQAARIAKTKNAYHRCFRRCSSTCRRRGREALLGICGARFADRGGILSAQAGADASRTVSPQALAVPTDKPLDSFDAFFLRGILVWRWRAKLGQTTADALRTGGP